MRSDGTGRSFSDDRVTSINDRSGQIIDRGGRGPLGSTPAGVVKQTRGLKKMGSTSVGA